ncbi:hypothetical protein L3Q82_005146 [Scortum barcoo]|uniref:Uncharacterized protein n=1 Tax=Scortum barcoo TaxID=214431 RepID=A0ACB8VGA8_9TELE|nr:hypothetical protein L3Q82_005146 [Scortum barcoo]
MDPLQLAYQPDIGVDDAVIYLLHTSLTHLEKAGSTVRIMFFDFSSAFNTIQPRLLGDKLQLAGVDHHLTSWILDYLTHRPTKFSDDSAVVGLITDGDDREYRGLIQDFVDWCPAEQPPDQCQVKPRSWWWISAGVDTLRLHRLLGQQHHGQGQEENGQTGEEGQLCPGMPLDSVEVVGNGRMMAKLSSLLDNTSHPLQDTLTALGSSFSERLLHPRCVKERHILSVLCTDPKLKSAICYVGLIKEIKDQLAPHESPDEFEDLVDLAVRIDNRLQERERERCQAGKRSSDIQGVPWVSGSFVALPRSRDQGRGQFRAISDDYPDLSKVPPFYHDLQEVFDKIKATSLPPHRHWDCVIDDLLPGAPIPKARLYAISGPERKAMEEYIQASLKSGIIRPSSSPPGAGFFCGQEGWLAPAMHRLQCSQITVKNRYPLPLISSTFELLQQARIFTKLDLRNVYHLVRIREGDEWKMGFNTPTGH